MNDADLLRAYASHGSESAFTELVNRYLGLVHSVAARHLADPSSAQELTQSVFLLLARKAPTLSRHPCLAGWLHRTAWHAAARAARSEARRRQREARAFADPSWTMKDAANDTEQILRVIDEAVARLPEKDHQAVITRYFLRRSMKEVGAALGTSEAGAKMRVGRAIDRLRTDLLRRGVLCSSTGLAAVLTEHATSSVSPSLAAAVLQKVASTIHPAPALGLFSKGLFIMSQFSSKSLVVTAVVLVLLGTVGSRLLVTDDTGEAASPADVRTREDAEGSRRSPSQLLGSSRSARSSRTEPSVRDLEAARRTLRLALALPLPKSGISWPEPAVLEALENFGSRTDEAFAALREALSESSVPSDSRAPAETEALQLLRTRGILAMGKLDKSVPGLQPYLWDLTTATDVSDKVYGFAALKNLGFEASDLPKVIQLLSDPGQRSPALDRSVTAALREFRTKEPEVFGRSIDLLASLLEHRDPKVQMGAANVLLGTPQVASDSRVLERVRLGLGAGESAALNAIESAKAAGGAARPLVDDLLRYAESTHVAHLRREALQAVAAIQPEAVMANPNVGAEQAAAETAEQIRRRVDSPTRTYDDLVAGLSDPSVAVTAAVALADWGPAASKALPALRAAVQGLDEDSRERIVQAIQRIDPKAIPERVSAETVLNGVFHASSGGEPESLPEGPRRADRLLTEFRAINTWRTPEEIEALTRNLFTADPSTGEAFLRGLQEKDPALASRIRTSLASRNPKP